MLHSIRLGDYREVLSDVQADLIFTSPPYNIGSKGPRRDGFRKQGKYDPKSFGAIRDYPDMLPEIIYQKQQIEFMVWAADHLKPAGVLVYNHKPRRRNKKIIHPAEWFLQPTVRRRLELVEELIWDRGSTHNHDSQQLWAQTERLYVFTKAGEKYQFDNSTDLPFRSDVWRINREQRTGHCAPFPIQLAEAVIAAWSRPGDLIMDPYSGSGTVIVAAWRTGRQGVGSEVLSKYHDMANARLMEVAV